VVFGCGGDRDKSKRPRMGRVAADLADRIVVTGDNPRSEDPEAIADQICSAIPRSADCVRIPDRGEAIAAAVRTSIPGEIVLIAGKGHEDYQEIDGVKHPFSDTARVKALLAANQP
jgi:UDP-N-acetylmuramyl tripeptide synthase